jgi:hypothetical protein
MTLRLTAGSLGRFFADAPNSSGGPGLAAWRQSVDVVLRANVLPALADSVVAELTASDELGWSAYGALVLWAAYAEHPDRKRPLMEPEEWHKDPAVLASSATGFASRFATLTRGVELWLPGTFAPVIEIAAPGGDALDAGSTGALVRELDELNAATWCASRAEILGWRDTVDGGSPRLEDLARRGFSTFVRLASRVRGKPLALWLDY